MDKLIPIIEYGRNGEPIIHFEKNGRIIATAVIKVNKNNKIYAENIPCSETKQCSENKP